MYSMDKIILLCLISAFLYEILYFIFESFITKKWKKIFFGMLLTLPITFLSIAGCEWIQKQLLSQSVILEKFICVGILCLIIIGTSFMFEQGVLLILSYSFIKILGLNGIKNCMTYVCYMRIRSFYEGHEWKDVLMVVMVWMILCLCMTIVEILLGSFCHKLRKKYKFDHKKKRLKLRYIFLSSVIFMIAITYFEHSQASELEETKESVKKESFQSMEKETEHIIEIPETNTETVETYMDEDDAETHIHIDHTPYYFYNHLTDSQKENYERILTGIEGLHSEIFLTTGKKETEELLKVISKDHPEFYWVSDIGYTYNDEDGGIVIKPDYPNYAKNRIMEIRESSKAILNKVSKMTTDYDKIKCIFEYVVDTVVYDKMSSDNQNLYSALVRKKSVCAGYARATQYLLQQSGIEALYVSGTSDGEAHAWNIVKCEGAYYHVDTTYGDTNWENASESHIQGLPSNLKYNYAYLLLDDEIILRTRTINGRANLPECPQLDQNYFKKNNLYFETFTEEVEQVMIQYLSSETKGFACMFSNKDGYLQMADYLDKGQHADLISRSIGIQNLNIWHSLNDEVYTVSVWY